jgi:hypothetical protein
MDYVKRQYTLWTTRYSMVTPLYMLQPEERAIFRACIYYDYDYYYYYLCA